MNAADLLATLVAANLAMTAGILAAIAARGTVRRLAGPRVAYALWLVPLLAGLATLLPARPASAVPAVSAPVQPMAEAVVAAVDLWPAQLPAPAAGQAVQQLDLTPVLLTIWAAGAGVMLALTLIRQRRSLRAFGTIKQDGEAARASGNAGPALVGVIFPQLVVPADFEQRFTEQERTLILAHERTHLSGGDTRINALVVLLTCINWFNPLVHVAARLVRRDQELACDAAVVERFPGKRRIYAEALLKTQLAPAHLPLGCTWPPRSSSLLKERVKMLAKDTPTRLGRVAGTVLIAGVTAAAGLVAWAQVPDAVRLTHAGATVSCENWNGKYTNDPKVDWDMFQPTGPVTLTVGADGKAQIATPRTFPADVYPVSTGTRSANYYGEDFIARRQMRPDFIENITFTGLDRASPHLQWQRIRLDETGPHEVWIDAYCEK